MSQIPPSASDANTSSNADKLAIVMAANQAFIDGAAFAIDQAISMGKFEVFINSIPRMHMIYIQHYFMNLGYNIAIPNYNNGNFQPAALFGEFWQDYWNGQGWFDEEWIDLYTPYSFLPFYNNHQTYQVLISWKTPLAP